MKKLTRVAAEIDWTLDGRFFCRIMDFYTGEVIAESFASDEASESEVNRAIEEAIEGAVERMRKC